MTRTLRLTDQQYTELLAKHLSTKHHKTPDLEKTPQARETQPDGYQGKPETRKTPPASPLRPLRASRQPAADLLSWQLTESGLPHEREYRFHPTRRWRFDLAFPAIKLAVEVDGGLFVQGGHSRGRARIQDMQRDIEANLLGWLVVRMPPEWTKPGQAFRYIEQLVKLRS